VATVVNEQVGAATDDIRCRWDGSAWGVSTTYIYIGYISSTGYKSGGGFRFQTVAVPNAATIITAYMTFQQVWDDYLVTTVNTKITGQLGDSAAFSDLADYQARRGTVVGGANDNNITSAQVAWDNIPGWAAESVNNSPEIKTVVQEIVDGTWANNDDMTLFWDDHDDRSTHIDYCVRYPYWYDHTTAKAAKLYIEYEVVTGACVQTVASHQSAMRR